MFSQPASTPITFSGRFSSATTRITPYTVAAPHMSYFISSMPSAGLIEMPPESKVSPLPTSTIGLASGFGLPLYSITDINDSFCEPAPTAR